MTVGGPAGFDLVLTVFVGVGTGVALLEQPDPAALDNVNTPEELQRAQGHLGGPPHP